MTQAEHRKTHKDFHRDLDSIVAEFIVTAGSLPSQTTLLEFMEWNYKMTKSAPKIKTSKLRC
jgi:hypothetical protein